MPEPVPEQIDAAARWIAAQRLAELVETWQITNAALDPHRDRAAVEARLNALADQLRAGRDTAEAPADLVSQIERILRVVAAHDEPDWGRTAAEIARLMAGRECTALCRDVETDQDRLSADLDQLVRVVANAISRWRYIPDAGDGQPCTRTGSDIELARVAIDALTAACWHATYGPEKSTL